MIVPVYNVEAYLPACMESLQAQTYHDYEILLVDDGSTDGSGALCDAYARQEARIRVLHKKNGGLADARNAGVQATFSPYVTFVDSDDWVHPRYLEVLVRALREGQADFSVVDLQNVYPGQAIRDPGEIVVENLPAREALRQTLYQKYRDVGACGILLPRAYALEYPFPFGKYFEDQFTAPKYFLKAQRVAMVRNQLYYYFQRGDSIMHTWGSGYLRDMLDSSAQLVALCSGDPALARAARHKRFSNDCRILLLDKDLRKQDPKLYETIRKRAIETSREILRDPESRRKNKIAACLIRWQAALAFFYWLKKALRR